MYVMLSGEHATPSLSINSILKQCVPTWKPQPWIEGVEEEPPRYALDRQFLIYLNASKAVLTRNIIRERGLIQSELDNGFAKVEYNAILAKLDQLKEMTHPFETQLAEWRAEQTGEFDLNTLANAMEKMNQLVLENALALKSIMDPFYWLNAPNMAVGYRYD